MFRRMAALGMVSIALAGAKTWTFDISQPAQAGNIQLSRGEYKLKVDGPKAVLMDKHGYEINVVASAEAADIRFDRTAVILSVRGGKVRLDGVQLGGESTRVIFEKGKPMPASVAGE